MNGNPYQRGALPVAAMLVAGLVAGTPIANAAGLLDEPANVLALASVHAGGVDFLPSVSYRGAVLTVSGGEKDFRRTFEAGERLSIGLIDPDGHLLPDGTYGWHLELLPDKETANQLRIAASRNGGEAPEAWQAQTGSFTVSQGLIASPEVTEGGPRSSLDLTMGGAGAATNLGAIDSQAGERLNAERSDDAVSSGLAVELREVPTPQARTEAATSGIALEDADETAVAAGASLEPRPVEANPSSEEALKTFNRQQAVSADGSNGRPAEKN